MKYIIPAALLVLTACAQPEPLCDRAAEHLEAHQRFQVLGEAQTWGKFDTQERQSTWKLVRDLKYQEDQCHETRNVQVISRGGDTDAYHRDSERGDRGDRGDSVPDGKTDPHESGEALGDSPEAPSIGRPERGNPGNDKPVGRAGEKADKGMAEQGNEGNKGKSN